MPLSAYEESAAFIREQCRARAVELPRAALVLGSGLGGLEEEAEGAFRLPYDEIPHFPRPSLKNHAGVLTCGRLSGCPTAILSGRVHYYEGCGMTAVAYMTRVMKRLGVRTLVLTNAAGAVNEGFRPGDLMLITDHIKLFSDGPSRGNVPPELGERFFDMSRVYTPSLCETARRCAAERDIPLREGVYFFMPGPQYETPAEIRAIRLLGGDAVGMSTVPEAIAASQCGLEVLGISCITNMGAGMMPGAVLNDEEVGRTARSSAGAFRRLLRAVVSTL
ncbi:MAG: purine-nucleoside phosphorylase [Clostridiales bacterium]|nr:purine-nucleoside phosphorylase [Clostridiales bacterium]